jgi:NADH-quinone oxidoreductase subunit M
LSLYRRVTFGQIEHEGLQQIADMDRREITIIAPLVAATLIFGFWPMPILELTAPSIDALIAAYQEALAAHFGGGQ